MFSGSRAVSMVQEESLGTGEKKKVHGGGMVLDWGVHLLDQILYMYGDRKIETVYASLTNITNQGSGRWVHCYSDL